MKKLIRSVALILALVTVFLVPVSADDFDNTGSWINVLDYATLNNSGSNFITFTNSVTVSFDTDLTSLVRFVDIVVNTAGADVASASINGNALTVIGLDSQVFRIYGSVGNITTGKYDLTLTANGTCYLDFMQFQVNGQYRLMYDSIGTLSVGSNSYTMTSSSSSVKHLFSGDNLSAFTANVYCSSWKQYDFIDFYITCFVEGIDSISARFNGLDVPISVSYLGGSTGSSGGESNNKFMIRMDVRGLDRTIVNYPFIEISGVADPGNNNQIVLVKVTGSVLSDSINPIYLYFRALGDRISSFFDSMAQRQDAYQADLEDWQQAHDKLLTDQFSLVIQRLSGISSAIVSMTNTLKVSIDTAGINVVDKLTTFQSSMEGWFSTVSAKLDQLIGGTSEGDELSQGAEDLEDQVNDIHDYEQSQQAVLDDNLPAIQDSVSLTGFTGALAFVQRYLNGIFLGIGDFKIVFAFPIVIGIFFFICNRIPGATRFGSSRLPRSRRK